MANPRCSPRWYRPETETELWCSTCKKMHDKNSFGVDEHSKTGFTYSCRTQRQKRSQNRRLDEQFECSFCKSLFQPRYHNQKFCSIVCTNKGTSRKAQLNGRFRHGMRSLPEYCTWKGMRARCNNQNSPVYKNYGGRGIKVCDEWSSFDAFVKSMGSRPSSKHTLERIDNDGDYCPSNCRWATRYEQARNTRQNKLLTVGGETLCLTDMAKKHGISNACLTHRIKSGLSPEQAIAKGAP